MKIFLCLIVLLLSAQPAKAHYFVWQDNDSGLSVSFPDTWKTNNNRGVDDALTISAPSDGEDPVCKIQISDDKRYTIYPPDFGDAVQRDAVSIPFWKSYMGNYDDYVIDRVFDGGGLGRWRASYALATYSKRDGTAYQQRRAIMFASLYYDRLYVVECSTLNHGYERWDNDFRSVIKSIDFKKAYHEKKIGDYHNFLALADKYFWAQTGPEGTTTY